MGHVWLYFNAENLVIGHNHVYTYVAQVLVALESFLQFRKNRCNFRSHRLLVNVGFV